MQKGYRPRDDARGGSLRPSGRMLTGVVVPHRHVGGARLVLQWLLVHSLAHREGEGNYTSPCDGFFLLLRHRGRIHWTARPFSANKNVDPK